MWVSFGRTTPGYGAPPPIPIYSSASKENMMNSQQIIEILRVRFGPKILAAFPAEPGRSDKHPRVHVDAADWRQLAEFIQGDPRLQLDWLACLSGMDYAADKKLAVVYDLYSFELKHTFAVKVFCDRDAAHIPSVCDLWPAANWHEREAFDMFGIVFDGHPNLERLLCAEEWVGYPLRKDYVFPKEYHGIPAELTLEWDPSWKQPAKPATPAKPPAVKPVV